MWVPPADARAFTDYRPACAANAQLAREMNASTYRAYRAGLVQPGALAHVQRFIAKPKPGDTQSITTYPSTGGQAPTWATSAPRKSCA
jgi:hypothetical protein